MSQSPEPSASESETIARCEAEVAEFTAQRDECVRRARALMAAEDPDAGVFHAEDIFRLQQDKLRLEVEIQLRTNKINRIRLGYGEDAPGPSTGGLVL